MPTGIPDTNVEGDLAETKWVIEFRNAPDPDFGRRQLRVFHYGSVVCSYGDEWYSGWVYPDESQDDTEEFYIRVTPDQLLLDEDADIPREDRGGNVGLWFWVTERNNEPPTVDMYYINNPHNNCDDPYEHVPRYHYDVVFASEQEIVG
jgi:hypothetical protein